LQLDKDDTLLRSIEKTDKTMKQHMDFHDFREREASKDLHKLPFSTSHYLSKQGSIEKALRDGERFETDKFYTKRKFECRPPQPLHYSARGFSHNTCTDHDRVNKAIVQTDTRHMSGFDRDTFVKADLHREPAKDHWLLKGGFKPSIRNDSLSKTV